MCIPCGPRNRGRSSKATEFATEIWFSMKLEEAKEHLAEFTEKELTDKIENLMRENAEKTYYMFLKTLEKQDKYLCRYFVSREYQFKDLLNFLHKEAKNNKKI